MTENPPTRRERTIKPRRIRFRYPVETYRHHYANDDLVLSHAVAFLSAVFPPGEDFFIRSVKHFRADITDPELFDQVAGFIGQELTHGREHRELNDRLQDMGYPTHNADRAVTWVFARIDQLLSPLTRLSFTAALEHYTATVAEILLTDPKAQALLGETEVRTMLLWHAYEESEHKSVAFDVYRTMGGGERRRVWGMRLVTAGFIIGVVLGTAVSLLQDRAAYNPIRLIRSALKLRHLPFIDRRMWRLIGEYNRPGFHPTDTDNAALLERWRTELFGDQGALTPYLR